MLTTSTSIALGLVFVLLGAVNIWLVLEAWRRVKAARASSRMLALHRVGGYLFIAVFCVMVYFMVARLRASGGDFSPSATIHLALAIILSPLLFIKVLIARYYKGQSSLLLPIGLTIFVLSFALIASTAGPYLARSSRFEQVAMDAIQAAPVTIDLNEVADRMQKRCSKCHNLDRVVGARKDAAGWLETVDRMRTLPASGISADDARTIVSYLTSQNRPPGPPAAERMEVARALVDQRCGRCHNLDRVYSTAHSPAEWRATVDRMVSYAAGSASALRPGEDGQIVAYLSANQTPEAASQRTAQVKAAASAGKSLAAEALPKPALPPAVSSHYDQKTLAFVSFVCLGVVALIVRRPKIQPSAAAKPLTSANSVAPARTPRAAPWILQLIQVLPQTPDSKTLRFAVHGPQPLDARPGQFLTFTFLFDGRKVTRCYSICSSPARSGYVEITPKRVANGCASVFLNDRAAVGLTVEATGPFGQFCFEPATHKRVVLLAAGSGITPMMAMLRYVDDLCLETDITLLYCARTAADIIFRRELDELQPRLKSFRCSILLSQPDPDWTGPRGRITPEFIRNTVPHLDESDFFLCGPPPFMQSARTNLADLGVNPERIRQETFGGAGADPKRSVSGDGLAIEFTRSGKAGQILEGQTLLEAAAAHGIEIPSACRQGQCGTCKSRLVSGQVRMTAEQGLDPDSKSRGYVLACVSHAETDISLDA